MFESILCQATDHDRDILESLTGLAVEIVREGRRDTKPPTSLDRGWA
jgi:hypothetical protein